jgi:hypothetical protein
MRKYLLHILIISFVFLFMPVLHSAEEESDRSGGKVSVPANLTIQKEPSYGGAFSFNLRSSYRKLSLSQVQSMSNISIRKKKDWGFVVHSTISHSYNLRTRNGDKVVVDNATGLMWHQNGFSGKSFAYESITIMRWDEAKEWVRNLNSRGYAGYRDWRLPTVEEAASLLESSKSNGRYIDPIFSKKQEWIWTGDRKTGSKSAWEVNFRYGHVLATYIANYNCVRPVRSMR